MNSKIIFASLLVLSFTYLPAQGYCPEGNPDSTDYIRRQPPQRCEGLKEENISGNSLSLISIATRNLISYGNNLTLQIPRIKGGKNPEVTVKSLGDNYHYQLDDFPLSGNASRFNFTWDTNILRKAKIPENSLRALASYKFGSQPVYVPVIVGQTSDHYEFVFYSQDRVRFATFEIIPKGGQKPIYRTSRPNASNGEIIFTWDGRNTPAGRYEIHYIANFDQRDIDSNRIKRRIVFEHNPNWLR
ncbi:hypothetical protein [Brasilonema sp. UFV-L1]|uniref:hypothetical protein n=1 Tax=Brasilonema sp. UFV-L1 TaxID=2234130 RepID=UPI00145D61A4|nr:hypothetical protein [Brasilonema sp. UFV-L1]NMG11040.1 hypothetical protein [Brasilonema sp. UFV-L1]